MQGPYSSQRTRLGLRPDQRPCRGIAVLMTALMLVFAIPLVGLAVDAGILYVVRMKLSMACDAGALAAVRALSRGLDDAAQQANATDRARQYIAINFPAGYFGVTIPDSPTVSIDETVANQRSVTVSATASAPTYFMRWLGQTNTNVSTTATAIRRDVNVMVVMDRSGSLATFGSCAPLQQAAINFVNRFANLRDNLGLVTFATSSMPDFPIANNFLSASTTVPTILGSLTCTGGTNSSQGLWQGYLQLVSLGQPNALNVILFFTDGYPTAFTGTFPILSTSTCADKTAKTAAMTAGFNSGDLIHPVVNWGLYNQVAQPQPMLSDSAIGPTAASARQNCSYAANWATSGQNVASDVKYLPASDVYGNAMNTGYKAVTSYDANGNVIVNPANIVNAAVNGADSAALRIRQGASVAGVGAGIPNVHVYSIGLGNAGGVPDDFLERVSNDPRASNFDGTKTSGFYIYVDTPEGLTNAFSRIASEILHISK